MFLGGGPSMSVGHSPDGRYPWCRRVPSFWITVELQSAHRTLSRGDLKTFLNCKISSLWWSGSWLSWWCVLKPHMYSSMLFSLRTLQAAVFHAWLRVDSPSIEHWAAKSSNSSNYLIERCTFLSRFRNKPWTTKLKLKHSFCRGAGLCKDAEHQSQ